MGTALLLVASKPAASAGIDWNAWTAIGTLALALVTLAAVITTIVITVQDRRNAAIRLKEEHQFATDAVKAEHDLAREQEQLDQAYAVVVVLGERAASRSTRTSATLMSEPSCS